MRLSIGGLEVRPSVWRKAFDDGGYDSDAAEDRAAGVALGYVAQVKWAPGCLVFLQVGLGGGCVWRCRWDVGCISGWKTRGTVLHHQPPNPVGTLRASHRPNPTGRRPASRLPGRPAALPSGPARLTVSGGRQSPTRRHLVRTQSLAVRHACPLLVPYLCALRARELGLSRWSSPLNVPLSARLMLLPHATPSTTTSQGGGC